MYVSYWEVMYGTWQASSCGCCLFWSARFTFQCKSIFFNFFWNSKLFLRLYKGFRSFNLFYKVSASVSFLSSPPLPALSLAPFFRTVFDSLPLNRTETLATQARSSCRLEAVESFLLLKYQGSLRLALYKYPYLLIVFNKRQKVF